MSQNNLHISDSSLAGYQNSFAGSCYSPLSETSIYQCCDKDEIRNSHLICFDEDLNKFWSLQPGKISNLITRLDWKRWLSMFLNQWYIIVWEEFCHSNCIVVTKTGILWKGIANYWLPQHQPINLVHSHQCSQSCDRHAFQLINPLISRFLNQ